MYGQCVFYKNGCFTLFLIADLGCRSLRFLKPVDEFALEGHVIQDVYLHMGTEPSGECRSLCGMESTCVSVNIGPQDENGDRLCQLSNSDHTQYPKDLKRREGFLYWATMVRNGRTGFNTFLCVISEF